MWVGREGKDNGRMIGKIETGKNGVERQNYRERVS